MIKKFKLVMIPLLMTSSIAFASCENSPQKFTESFYKWYLTNINDENSVNYDNIKITQSTTAALQNDINIKIESPDGLESDYFLKTQDYEDDWAKFVKSEPVIENENAAEERIILGNGPNMQELRVRLLKEGKCWKIDHVQ